MMRKIIVTLFAVFVMTELLQAQTDLKKVDFSKHDCNDSLCTYTIKFSSASLDSLSNIVMTVTVENSGVESVFMTDYYKLESRDSSQTVYLIGDLKSQIQVNNQFEFSLPLIKDITALHGKIAIQAETKNHRITNVLVYYTNEL
jgi:hypothetical protein